MEISSQQVHEICKGDEEIARYFHMLLAQNQLLSKQVEQQAQEIAALKIEIHELKRQLGQNSKNSSKPPSSDGPRKIVSSRTSGGKKGAPKGHPGTTLKFSDQPDEIVIHKLSACSGCGASLETVESTSYERRQVVDLPPPKATYTEHRVEKKCCGHCGLTQKAPFPDEVTAPVQYGAGFTAWTAYLHAYQMLPLGRIAQLFEDLTAHRLSEGTLLSMLQTMYNKTAPLEEAILQALLHETLVHADETGCSVGTKKQWVHVVSNDRWTLLQVHTSRGSQAMDELRFFPFYTGNVVHDCLAMYFKDIYRFRHALCNAHLLRECFGITENDGHKWSREMADLLLESWRIACEARSQETEVSDEVIRDIKSYYDVILEEGRSEWMNNVASAQRKKTKAANLGERMALHKESILRFLWDAYVPFDNNQAERDLRMIKVKQKVSGLFRTETGAKIFVRLRSIISTLTKQQHPVLISLTQVLGNQFRF